MRHEPPISHVRLIAMVRDRYGLPVGGLTFVPVGYAAACYTVQCMDEAPIRCTRTMSRSTCYGAIWAT